MSREIGSEFWEADISDCDHLIIDQSYRFLLVGRTALDYIIHDLRASNKLKSVYMPSYCCHTMIQPFIEHGVSIEFYNITFEHGQYHYDINYDTECDTVLIMQYFGYNNPFVESAIIKFKEKRKIVIEDATHSWFLEKPFSNYSDYVFTSFRKWTGFPCGAIAIKNNGEFDIEAPHDTNIKYIELRKYAAKLKQQYVHEKIGKKEFFLQAFTQAEQMLDTDYKNYGIPNDIQDVVRRIDIGNIRKKRSSNAKFLIKRLEEIQAIETVKISDMDIPLFVPIIVKDGRRDKLRQYLIKKDIYCPVHWPLTTEHRIMDKNLYDNGMSLICDQRYTELDMGRVVDTILSFYGGKI